MPSVALGHRLRETPPSIGCGNRGGGGEEPGRAIHVTRGDGYLMDRQRFLETLLGCAALPLVGCADPSSATAPCQELADGTFEVTKSDAEWRELLTPSEFEILCQEGTEVPYTSALDGEWQAGTYICKACFLPLFLSETKYDSGTGWPSFWEPIAGQLGFRVDCSLRVEYNCQRCGSHQGTLFPDGPPPTGKRYCNNGLALTFVSESEPLPDLRT